LEKTTNGANRAKALISNPRQRKKDMIDFPFVAPFLCFFLWTNKERKEIKNELD
jgi:hypothetical protein